MIGIPATVRTAAVVLAGYLRTVQICDQCERDEIVLDLLDGLIRGETRCCGEAADESSGQLRLFDFDPETGEVVWYPDDAETSV